MQEYQLNNADDEEISISLIPKIEKSFGLEFGIDDFKHVVTFGEFCDIILSKFPVDNSPDCTSQQAFYKLRRALERLIPGTTITPATSLETLLPNTRKERKQIMRLAENELGVALGIISISRTVQTAIICAFLVSFAVFFISIQAGIIGLTLSIISAMAADEFGNTLRANTVTDIVKKMTREHYAQSRRNPSTVNRAEIVKQVQELFQHDLDLSPAALTRDARF